MGSLFLADDDSAHNAYLDRLLTPPWCLYRDGYQQAAFLLIEQCKTFYDRNTLIYPIVFLFRHHIELCLKEFIVDGKGWDSKLMDSRNLKFFWKNCKDIIKECHLPITTEELEIIENGVHDFDGIDPSSYVMRYPVNKRGVDSVADRENPISIRELKSAMDELVRCLEKLINLLAIDSDMRMEFDQI